VQSKQRIRVLFIHSSVDVGADGWVHQLLMRSLPRDRFELHLAAQPRADSPHSGALPSIDGLNYRPTHFGPTLFGRSKLERWRAAAADLLPAAASLIGLARYIRAHRIQILHASDRPRDALACVALAALTDAKACVHIHVKFDTWMSRGQRWALRNADRVVGVSEFVVRSLIRGGHRPERLRAVLNAIEPADWDPSEGPATGRALLGVPAGSPLLLCVARIFHWKGHALLIRALAAVKREISAVKLVVVGADYPEGSGETAKLEQLARELGVSDDVSFVGQRRDVPQLLAACDVFVLPSYEEPFGLVYAEAMAMKRPVVGLTNGGTPEVVEHGRSGLLSEPHDVDGLARNLVTLLRDPELRARLGEYGRSDVERRFHPGRLASDFARVYEQMLDP
jgi:glycosyltransferase involved in cell wall biosynthesis